MEGKNNQSDIHQNMCEDILKKFKEYDEKEQDKLNSVENEIEKMNVLKKKITAIRNNIKYGLDN